ncbi:MAG TPA: APC family permease [Mycobacteriales bacterium]|jgi:amino acid transporter|nr:APC family permease [Mycobacteriales bacterium]
MTTSAHTDRDAERLQSLGYRQELSRVLGFFDNFSVAFTYLSPMVGIFSLFVLGVGTAGPAYIWLMPLVVIGMLFVASVFGELGSHYPIAGALYQYSKFNVGPAYGWWVGWFYGVALLLTVASVDTGVAPYVASLSNNWFNSHMDPTNHTTILVITLCLLAVQTTVNIVGARAMGRVARFGTYVEVFGTFGVALILLIAGFHHGLGFLFHTQGAAHVASNPLGVNFHGNWLLGAALVGILAHVYIFYGFESAGDIAEETKDPGRSIPRAMRSALVFGGISSFVLVLALLLAMPSSAKGYTTAASFSGGVPYILGFNLTPWVQDVVLVAIIYAFFSCGSSVQGAGARLAFSYARDGAIPGAKVVSHVSRRFHTPANALLIGAIVPVLATLLVNINPAQNHKFLFITYPAGVNALVALVSFAVSGIYLSFLMTVIGAAIARRRGWQPAGSFTLGRWGWPVTIAAIAYLGLMLVNVVVPSGLSSGRALFNLDWITLAVMVVITAVGAVLYLIAQPEREIAHHVTEPASSSEIPGQRGAAHDTHSHRLD